MICRTCHQPIVKGQTEDLLEGVHKYAEDCVAATEAATARKCAEVTCWWCKKGLALQWFPQINNHMHVTEGQQYGCNAAPIRRAYPKAFAQEEQPNGR